MAPFRLDKDELEHDLPWRLMQNSPVTLYRLQQRFESDLRELRSRGFQVATFDCRSWSTEDVLHDALRSGLGLPEYTGRSFDALDDSLADS